MARAIVAKQPILCDGQSWRIGESFDAAPDVANRLVSQGYAEYAPTPPADEPTKPETPAEGAAPKAPPKSKKQVKREG